MSSMLLQSLRWSEHLLGGLNICFCAVGPWNLQATDSLFIEWVPTCQRHQGLVFFGPLLSAHVGFLGGFYRGFRELPGFEVINSFQVFQAPQAWVSAFQIAWIYAKDCINLQASLEWVVKPIQRLYQDSRSNQEPAWFLPTFAWFLWYIFI